MGSLTRFSKGLVAALLAGGAALSLGGCGPNYAIFKVHVSAATPRDDIWSCKMTIADESGHCVVSDYELQQIAGPVGQPNSQGCGGGVTPANVGYFSYSSSRSSGTLKFTVNAVDNSGNVVETNTSADIPIQAYPPEIGVEVGMTRTPTPKPPTSLCCNLGTGAGC